MLGIVKAYTTRVGDGPFPTELHRRGRRSAWASAARSSAPSPAAPRRCGWFDAVLVRQSVAINGIDGIALTKLDVLDGLEELKICVGYELDGERIDHLPAGLKAQAALEPIYEEIEGWRESTRGARSFRDLPAAGGQVRAPHRGADRRAGGAARHQPGARRHDRHARSFRRLGADGAGRMSNRGTIWRRAAWGASWIVAAGLLHPAWATSVQTYGKNEYVVVANGMAPDQRYAVAAHGIGEDGSEDFHLYSWPSQAGG